MTIGSAAGFCEKHKMDKMFIGTEDATEPTCVKCVADATPKIGRTQVVEDPGEEYFKTGKSEAKIGVTEVMKAHQSVARALNATTLEEIVNHAVASLNALPMPKDIKEFKRIQKVIKTLQTLTEKTNG